MTHTNHTPDAVPPAQGADEPGTPHPTASDYEALQALPGYADFEAELARTRAAVSFPAVPQGAAEPTREEAIRATANTLVGGDVAGILPAEVHAAFERCYEYICMRTQGGAYGLFDAKADLWRVTTFAAATLAALHQSLASAEARTKAMWEEREGWKRTASERWFALNALKKLATELLAAHDDEQYGDDLGEHWKALRAALSPSPSEHDLEDDK